MKRLLVRSEFIIAVTIVILCIVIGMMNQAFFTLGNFFDLLQSGVEMGIFSLGVLIVLISGGIDVSFTAIAIFSLYLTAKILNAANFHGNVLMAFVVAGIIGIILGLFNAIFIGYFQLPTLIVTLGTSSLFQGFMLVVVGTFIINTLPDGMRSFGHANIFTLTAADGTKVGLPASFLILVGATLLVWLMLKYTTLGRGIYALGGDAVAAKRVGFNSIALQFFIYAFVGLLSGVVGVIHGSSVRNANPFDLVGTELNVIAAVVLGGARVTGGHGTVLGTLLGVFLVDIMNNSLILLGVPSYWQRVVIGLLILLGTGLTAYQSHREAKVNLMGA